MHVIGHQAVGPDVELVPACLCSQDKGIRAVVVVAEEDLHPSRATLSDVVWNAWDHDAGEARHRLVRRKLSFTSCLMSILSPLFLCPRFS